MAESTAVGVFREVLVARRIEQVEDISGIFKGHHGGDNRDAAVALDAHPVGPGLATVGLGAHLARELDGTAKQQKLFGQRGLARVRMRDDRECAPPADGIGSGHGGLTGQRGAHRPLHVNRTGVYPAPPPTSTDVGLNPHADRARLSSR